MLVIPELKKVVIMPPRTGSKALKKTITEVYKQTICPHRHGEAQMFGTHHVQQFGHDASEYGFVYLLRDPIERMKSLWRYMQNVSKERNKAAPLDWVYQQNKDADKPFSDWVFESRSLFSAPDNAEDEYHRCAIQVPAVHKSATQYLHGVGSRSLQILRCYNENDYVSVLDMYAPAQINTSTPSIWDDTVTDAAMHELRMYHALDFNLMEIHR